MDDFFVVNGNHDKIVDGVLDDSDSWPKNVRIGAVRGFRSLIWNEKYSTYGDFQLVVPASDENINLYRIDNVIHNQKTSTDMIIDSLSIKKDADGIRIFEVAGFDCSVLLTRRAVFDNGGQQISRSNVNVQALIVDIFATTWLGSNPFHAGPMANYRISSDWNFDPSEMVYDEFSYFGGTFYDFLKTVCDDWGLGFSFKKDWEKPDDNTAYILTIYQGVDRSTPLSGVKYVEISTKIGNLAEVDYTLNNQNYCNYAVVLGGKYNDDDSYPVVVKTSLDKYVASNYDNQVVPWLVREIFVDSSSQSAQIASSEKMTLDQYKNTLVTRGLQDLATRTITEGLDATLSNILYEYGEDYNIGDIVRVRDLFGIDAKARITSMIYSVDDSGEQYYPTIELLERNQNGT
jgi:hypothetical protein